MTEPQVTMTYPQPTTSNGQQGLPPVGVVYTTQSYANPSQATYPQQQSVGYPQQHVVNPSQHPVYPTVQPGQSTKSPYPSQNEAQPPPPPPYQAAPPHVIVKSTNEPVPGQAIVRVTQQQPNDFLVWAILATIFCCLPCGLVAIIKASNVRSQFASGDYEGAERSSKEAKKVDYY